MKKEEMKKLIKKLEEQVAVKQAAIDSITLQDTNTIERLMNENTELSKKLEEVSKKLEKEKRDCKFILGYSKIVKEMMNNIRVQDAKYIDSKRPVTIVTFKDGTTEKVVAPSKNKRFVSMESGIAAAVFKRMKISKALKHKNDEELLDIYKALKSNKRVERIAALKDWTDTPKNVRQSFLDRFYKKPCCKNKEAEAFVNEYDKR